MTTLSDFFQFSMKFYIGWNPTTAVGTIDVAVIAAAASTFEVTSMLSKLNHHPKL